MMKGTIEMDITKAAVLQKYYTPEFRELFLDATFHAYSCAKQFTDEYIALSAAVDNAMKSVKPSCGSILLLVMIVKLTDMLIELEKDDDGVSYGGKCSSDA